MKLTIIFIYGFLFSVTFLIFALVWHGQMQNVYFVTRDKGLIMDFFPPFIQDGASGNFFIRSPRVVYTIWFVYFGAAVLIPAVASWLLVRLYDHSLKKSWM